MMKSVCSVPVLFWVMAVAVLFSPSQAWTETTISTVGPCGDFTTIQSAIDAAVVGSDNEIRVQRGITYVEKLVIRTSFGAGAIRIEGGWDCPFEAVDQDPAATVIDAGGEGPVVTVSIGGGLLYLGGMTLTNGLAEKGGGINARPSGDASVILENLVVVGNTTTSPGMVSGGGINADLDGFETLEIRQVVVRGNQAISTGSAAAYGGGISVAAIQDAEFLVTGCRIADNLVQSINGNLLGAGLYASASDRGRGRIEDSSITFNSASGSLVLATGVHLNAEDSADLIVERMMVALNSVKFGTDGPQVKALAQDLSSLWIRDSGITWGDFRGLEASAWGGSRIYLTNLTVANHGAAGATLTQDAPAVLTLFNTISFDNGTNLVLSGNITSGCNLIGVDPLFVDAATLDFHLQAGSPAVDTGDNDPPGGLGAFDVDGLPRIFAGVVDIGMCERGSLIFSDGFESGDLSGWSMHEPESLRAPQFLQ